MRTPRDPWYQLSGVAVIVLVSIAPGSCGRDYEVVRHYELNACPSSDFAFPDTAIRVPFPMKRDKSAQVFCPGFTAFATRPNGQGDVYYDVRLRRGAACTVDAAYGYLGGKDTIAPDSARTEVQMSGWADSVVRALLDRSGAQPTLPPQAVERLSSYEARQAWCARKP